MIEDSLSGILVGNLVADPAGSVVYAATIDNGVFDYEAAPPAPCVPSDTTACLHGGRFGVHGTYAAPSSPAGDAHVVQLTADSAYFSFFGSADAKVLLKVIDGCGLNGAFWVYAHGPHQRQDQPLRDRQSDWGRAL